jgi:8-oxo-dGTP pyrophosphatase MutT (NUDIX family)
MKNFSNLKYRKAVFILVYSINSKTKKPEYLVLKRKLHWIGWEFPKGGIEWYDFFKRRAAIRELREETGIKKVLKIKKFDFSGRYPYAREYSDRRGFQGQTYILYAAQVEKPKTISIDKKEHSDFKWLTYDKALKTLKWSNQKTSLEIVNLYLKIKFIKNK